MTIFIINVYTINISNKISRSYQYSKVFSFTCTNKTISIAIENLKLMFSNTCYIGNSFRFTNGEIEKK